MIYLFFFSYWDQTCKTVIVCLFLFTSISAIFSQLGLKPDRLVGSLQCIANAQSGQRSWVYKYKSPEVPVNNIETV